MNCDQLFIGCASCRRAFGLGARPTKPAVLLPTGSIGLTPVAVSSMYMPGVKYSGMSSLQLQMNHKRVLVRPGLLGVNGKLLPFCPHAQKLRAWRGRHSGEVEPSARVGIGKQFQCGQLYSRIHEWNVLWSKNQTAETT